MLLGLALYTISDALIKHLMDVYPVHQATFLRSLMRLIALMGAVVCTTNPKAILTTSHPTRHAIRLVVSLAYTYTFMYTFSMSSLTVIYTLSYTSPLFMLLLSYLFFKEKISIDRWGAVAIGLIGVLIATKPGSTLFEWGAILVLLASFLGALNKVLMRKLASTEHSLTIAIYPNIVMMIITLPFLFHSWTPMPMNDWILFGVMGILTAVGQYAIAEALRYAQISILAPIDYSTFFWAIAFDCFFWQETPYLNTLLGALVIVGSNLYILYSSASKKKT
jgi:drug/metabolite transporter (DMT)-like permease